MTLKLLLLEVNPKLRIFLDVDDLNNVHDLEVIKVTQTFK